MEPQAAHDRGLRAAKSNKERYDKLYADEGGYYSHIGRLGGLKSKGGGFAKDRALAVKAGKKGGKSSRRGPVRPKEEVQMTLTRLERIADNAYT